MAEPEDLLSKADALMARHRPGRTGDTPYAEIPVLDEVVDLPQASEDLRAPADRAGPASPDEERTEALTRYGAHLGTCFQMVDDLLDFTAEEETLGKPVANDLREGKVTLPMIFLLRRAGNAEADKVRAVLDDRGFGRVTREEIVRLARDHGALEEARALASSFPKRVGVASPFVNQIPNSRFSPWP